MEDAADKELVAEEFDVGTLDLKGEREDVDHLGDHVHRDFGATEVDVSNIVDDNDLFPAVALGNPRELHAPVVDPLARGRGSLARELVNVRRFTGPRRTISKSAWRRSG